MLTEIERFQKAAIDKIIDDGVVPSINTIEGFTKNLKEYDLENNVKDIIIDIYENVENIEKKEKEEIIIHLIDKLKYIDLYNEKNPLFLELIRTKNNSNNNEFNEKIWNKVISKTSLKEAMIYLIRSSTLDYNKLRDGISSKFYQLDESKKEEIIKILLDKTILESIINSKHKQIYYEPVTITTCMNRIKELKGMDNIQSYIERDTLYKNNKKEIEENKSVKKVSKI